MTSYGALGVGFIVLFILGHVATSLLVVGFLLVAIDVGIQYSHNREIRLLRKDILALGSLLVYIYSDETEEEVNGL